MLLKPNKRFYLHPFQVRQIPGPQASDATDWNPTCQMKSYPSYCLAK